MENPEVEWKANELYSRKDNLEELEGKKDQQLCPSKMKMYDETQLNFIDSFNDLSRRVYKTAKEKGFWENGKDHNDGEKIALMHSELSETLEAVRQGNPPDDKLPEFSGAEVELADTIIRIMDFAHVRSYRVAEALIEKMAFNSTREYKHGKAF